ncbi:hypothetical protein MTR67_043930 [Solanum verrucosum]|uniref:Integrase zinc-binding domain-containing protein n=1 Tax=Solanum verrucosum TaxID=315347 RepID=A0AAF0UPY0_SOLVR|nr:hypothetical protein MTR67_043930 [Solanum verrucosum]
MVLWFIAMLCGLVLVVLLCNMGKLAWLGVRLVDSEDGSVIIQNGLELSLVWVVNAKEDLDPIMMELKKLVFKKSIEALSQGGDAQSSRYFIHPRSTKMYYDLQEVYWLNGMKKDIAKFVAKYPNCQQVKVKHQKSRVLVIVDQMTKSAHFLPVKISFSIDDYDRLYIREMVRGIVTRVKLSTTLYPQKDGQAERIIHTLEDMVRACVIDFKEISPMKSVMRFEKKGDLSPCYVGLYHILRHFGKVASELNLPSDLASYHAYVNGLFRASWVPIRHVMSRIVVATTMVITRAITIVVETENKVKEELVKEIVVVTEEKAGGDGGRRDNDCYGDGEGGEGG